MADSEEAPTDLSEQVKKLTDLAKSVTGTRQELTLARCIDIFLEEVGSLLPEEGFTEEPSDPEQLCMTTKQIEELQRSIQEYRKRRKG